jgi:Domain of unknown function (DUF4833)
VGARPYLLFLSLLVTQAALADEIAFGPNDVPTVFAISKSDDHNQVQYALRLDARCLPVGKEPVFGYWREYEKTPNRLLGLSWLDQFGYGIARQQVSAERVVMTIKTAPSRQIEVVAAKREKGCAATAYTTISGKRAALSGIALKLSGPFSVESVTLSGLDPETHQPVSERVIP